MAATTEHWSDQLPTEACNEAVEWCRTYDTFDEAWQACERGDWMLWLVGHYAGGPGSDKRRPLVLAACECARLVLQYISTKGDQARIAIETAEKWARGEDGVSLEDVRSAAATAAVASIAAVAPHAYHASRAASIAATAATAAASIAPYTAAAAAVHAARAYAAHAAIPYATVVHAVYRTARKRALKTRADIVRNHYPHFHMEPDNENAQS